MYFVFGYVSVFSMSHVHRHAPVLEKRLRITDVTDPRSLNELTATTA